MQLKAKFTVTTVYSLQQFWEIHFCAFFCDVIESNLPVPDYSRGDNS